MISFTEWISESISTLRNGERSLPTRLLRPAYYIYVGGFLTLNQYATYGTNIYNREWDVLLILDACRVDALREVAEEYDFISEVNSIRSVGSTSFEWLNHTFTTEYRDEISRTAYVTGNAYSERVFGQDGETGSAAIPFGPAEYDVVHPDDFGYLEETWRADVSDEWIVGEGDQTGRHPQYMSDRAISVKRSIDPERLIVHYMYPHDPFPLAGEELYRPFEALKSGRASQEEVWEAYLDTLRLVLDSVELLLENIDADRVAITADHGEAFGEYGFYRHVIGCPIPCMRRVPWVETVATDEATYEPTAPKAESDLGVEEQLEHLGYL